MINLEIYDEHAPQYSDPLMWMPDVGAVPRVGDRVVLRMTEKVLGEDEYKEHRDWEVVRVEWHFDSVGDTNLRLKYGTSDTHAVYVKRIFP